MRQGNRQIDWFVVLLVLTAIAAGIHADHRKPNPNHATPAVLFSRLDHARTR